MMKTMQIGRRDFEIGNRLYVMGILNVTPDSFSDGGSYNHMDQALYHAQEMIDDGADLIDIGGESTRPGYSKITDEEEIDRVTPVIEALKQRFDIPLSIDTYKSGVAKAAIQSGADLINDIWGLKADRNMAKVIADSNTVACLMHNRNNIEYKHFFSDVMDDLQETLTIADAAGIDRRQIILDPGIGFGKTVDMNLEIIKYLDRFKVFDMPLLLGVSRKSVIGLTLSLPVSEREEGTIVSTVFAALKGCHFVRVHNVKGNVRAIRMVEAIQKERMELYG